MNTKLSVIIPAHNEENYIKKTLHSLKNQTFQNFETIIVSNGCSDRTEEIVQKRENERLKQISISEANVSIARNRGAQEALGETLVFLDADTTLEENALQKINQEFTEKYVVGTTLSSPDINSFRYKIVTGFKNFHNTVGFYEGCSGVLICRKEDFSQVGGYDPKIIVKEHRKLNVKLRRKTNKKFRCIKTTAVTSMRRYKEWGVMKASWFWIKQWFKNYTGKIKESKYEKVR
jgi:glycosyltransferase involved in cell wall biosynthesis